MSGTKKAKRTTAQQRSSANGHIKAYEYNDEYGNPLFRVLRRPNKQFHQERWDRGWKKGLGDTQRVLYNLQEVVEEAEQGGTVWVTEGEKDADEFIERGEVATTNPGGAGKGKWREEYTEYLEGCDKVNIVWDNDEEGRAHALHVAEAIDGLVPKIRFFRARTGNDAYDHFSEGFEIEDLVRKKPRMPEKKKEKDTSAQESATGVSELPAVYQLAILRLEAYAGTHGLPKPRQTSPVSYEACCPAHDDQNPSLGIRVGEVQPVVVSCQAGCGLEDIAEALQIDRSEFSVRNLNKDIEKEVARLRVRREAVTLLASENLKPIVVPKISMEEYLLTAPKTLKYTVDQLHIKGGNTLLVSQFKTGKTTLLLNLMRCLADGAKFLDHFSMRRIEGRVGYLDYEMHEDQFRNWASGMGIRSPYKIATPWHLRGTTLPFWTPEGQEVVVEWLKNMDVEILIVDPAARAWSGLVESENNNTEVGKFTEALDELKKEAGIVDLFLATHMGRAKFEEDEERSRGATRLEDWADSIWYMTQDKETNTRSIRAIGRSIEMEATTIQYDPLTQRLTTSGEKRAEYRVSQGVQVVVDALVRMEGTPTTSELSEEIGGNKRTTGKAIREAENRGYIIRVKVGKSLNCQLTTEGQALHDRKYDIKKKKEKE